MIQMLATAQAMKWDWPGWIRGIVSAFVVGGTGSIGAGFGGLYTDPQHFNPAGGMTHLFTLMGWTFVFTGVISLAAYLHNHPLPEPWDGTDRRI